MASARQDDDRAEKAEREAAEWFVRLNGPHAAADRRAFQDWLAADPAHAGAFRRTGDLWNRLAEPAARLARQNPPLQGYAPRRPFLRAAALAASLAVMLAGAMLWRDAGMLDRAFADHATRPGDRLEVTLEDGSRLYLDGDSAITNSFSNRRREVTLLRGRAWFDVASDPARPFVVFAGPLETRVLGTAFGIDRESANVTVDRGTVTVTAPAGAPVRLAAGQRVEWAGGRLSPPETVDPEVALAWRRGLIVLDAAPLGDVVDELARMTPGRMIVPDAGLRALTLSGTFRADDPGAVIEAMHTALGLRTISVPGFATLVYR